VSPSKPGHLDHRRYVQGRRRLDHPVDRDFDPAAVLDDELLAAAIAGVGDEERLSEARGDERLQDQRAVRRRQRRGEAR